MKLYSKNDYYKLYQGSMLDMLEVIGYETIDSIVTDPPYELNFMNKEWDNSGIAFQTNTWKKCYELLKPGGYLLAFGGSRTFHRIACAIEDAGFEIRDTIMWLYGSGFPKSMNIGLAIDKKLGLQGQRGVGGFNVGGIQEQQNRKAKLYIGSTSDGSKKEAYQDYKSDLSKKWAGYGTALKPSFEPIIVARKPFKGSLVDNVLEYGVGGINIDECRIESEERTIPIHSQDKKEDTTMFSLHPTIQHERMHTTEGRFPANTILTYDETDFHEVCGGFPYTKGEIGRAGRKNGGNYNASSYKVGVVTDYGLKDSGSASRYFYCAKASKKDRDEGLEKFEEKNMRIEQNRKIHSAGCEYIENGKLKQNPHLQSSIKKNIHPTVKPTELMQYLVRLVTPKGGVVLDPFNGSGSTGKAVIYENRERDKGYKYIGIELNEEYLNISKARIEYVCNLPIETQQTLFDLEDK